jgi:hypothetical protein
MPHGVCEGRVLSAKPCVEHVKKRNRCPQDKRFACTKAEAPHEVGYLSTAEVGWQHSPTFLFGYCTYHGELTYVQLLVHHLGIDYVDLGIGHLQSRIVECSILHSL